MKKSILIIALLAFCIALPAQNTPLYKEIVKELSSKKYQGRGYAKDGVLKAGDYIEKQFRKAGVDEVILQPFTININTFPGKMKMWVDGRKLTPGDDFVMREYSPGVKGSFPLYFIDTANFDFEQISKDLQKPEYKNAFVVCDFWFPYKHGKEFSILQSDTACPNAGLLYTWETSLKFYKAYGENIAAKPIVWTTAEAVRGAKNIKLNVENKFLSNYESSNVIAKIDGESHDSCFVFTAHYDHLGNLGRKLYFPGANDNASGTAAIITLAEYYAKHKPKYDMIFIAFSGEDANLRGSTYYVEHPIVPLSNIKYLFNLDMIGDNNPVQYCEVSEQGMKGFAEMEAINAKRHYFQSLNRGELAANSDHYPFAVQGVPCIFYENEEGDAFQYYHTANDTFEHFYSETYGLLFKLITEFIGY